MCTTFRWNLPTSIFRLEAGSSETLVIIYPTLWHSYLNTHHRQNLRFLIVFILISSRPEDCVRYCNIADNSDVPIELFLVLYA
jgi:hypothetical protein